MATTYRQRKPKRYRYMTNYYMIREPGGLYGCAEAYTALNNGLTKQMIDVETLVPSGVLCLYSEWSYHELTTQIPQAYHIAVERTRRITLPMFPPIELSFMTQKAYELGVVEVEIDSFEVKVYDLEKSVCDALKYRNKIGLNVSSKISNNHLSRKERDITQLHEYASQTACW